MSFESVLYNKMNTGAGNCMDGSFKGSSAAFTFYSEDIGSCAQTSQELWKISSCAKKRSLFSRMFGVKA